MNKYLGIVAIVALILGGFSVAMKSTVEVEREVIREIVREVGAMPGPDISSPYLSINGVRLWPYHSVLQTATQTPCSFRTPAATTTLIHASIRYNTGSTTAFTTYIGKGAVRTATTTRLGQGYLAANAKGVIIATTTPLDGTDEDKTIAPSNWINFGMYATEANSGGTFSPKGACDALLLET